MVNFRQIIVTILLTALPVFILAQEWVKVELYPSQDVIKGQMTEFVYGDHITIKMQDSLLTYTFGEVRNIRVLPGESGFVTRRNHDFDRYQKKLSRTNLRFVPFVGVNACKLTGKGFKTKYGVGFNLGGYSASELTSRLIIQNEIMFSIRNFEYDTDFDPFTGEAINKGNESQFLLQLPTILKYKIPTPNSDLEFYPGVGLGLSIPVWAQKTLKYTYNATDKQDIDILDNLETVNLNMIVAFAIHYKYINADLQYSHSLTDVYLNPEGKYFSGFELKFALPGVSNYLSSALQQR